jgi:hypothetical protein
MAFVMLPRKHTQIYKRQIMQGQYLLEINPDTAITQNLCYALPDLWNDAIELLKTIESRNY